MPIFESLLRQFQNQRGLFILGAGASAGSVNLGTAFLRAGQALGARKRVFCLIAAWRRVGGKSEGSGSNFDAPTSA